MRSVVASLLLAGLIGPASADSGGDAPVIGGTDAPAGKWPDIAATLIGGEQECTGTLVAPTVVITAAHCVSSGSPGSVAIGISTLARMSDGDIIAVQKRIPYPNADRSYDIAVLVLQNPSRFEPRPIATGWVRPDIVDGAQVAIAGFGALDRSSMTFKNELQEAMTTITDADCTKSAGCNSLARPAGELGAGGMGIDTCPGDSGGPLYLVTEHGTFLAGVTSRGYDDNQFDCSEGGIYVRPDKVIDWIEESAGVPVTRGPEPTFDPLTAVRGTAAESKVVANDPRSTSHAFVIATQPAHGKAAIREDGLVRVCTDPGVVGDDVMTVTVTDTANTNRAVTIKVPIKITDGEAGEGCDPEAFGDAEGGGCCDAGRRATGSLPLAIGVLALLRRRRR